MLGRHDWLGQPSGKIHLYTPTRKNSQEEFTHPGHKGATPCEEPSLPCGRTTGGMISRRKGFTPPHLAWPHAQPFTRTGHRRHTDNDKPGHNSFGPFGLTTFGSGGEGADLSPAASSGGMRRRPRAQAALLERTTTCLRIAFASCITAALVIRWVWCTK